MNTAEIFMVVPRLVGLLGGLLLPGYLLLRACRLRGFLGASFLASGVVLYVSVLSCTLVHLPVTAPVLALCLGSFCVVMLVLARRSHEPRELAEAGPWAFLTTLRAWSPLYGAFWIIAVWRLSTDPLSGPDVHFRWSHLAEQMLRLGSLDFYPPRSSADFVRYFWPESIPPGIASLYAWAYACGGNFHPLWTGPVVALQLLSLHDFVWRLAFRRGGENAARTALLLTAACPLLSWSFFIGQETGLLATAVCGLVWCLEKMDKSPARAWAVIGGVFAVAAASTREYGLAYPALAIGAALLFPSTRRNATILAAVALPVAAIWPVRVWLMTGNPFFSLKVAGLFPTNAIFVAWNNSFRAGQESALTSTNGWLSLARHLVLWALPAVLGVPALAALLFRRGRETIVLAAFVLAATGLWLMSVAYTAGGLFYSLRALAPTFALLVVAAGCVGESIARSRPVKVLAGVALLLLSLEAFPKTLVLPENPYRVPVAGWTEASRKVTESFHASQPALAAKLAKLPGPRRIVSDGFDLPELGASIGLEVEPVWSPDCAWLLDPAMAPEVAEHQRGQSGLRFLVMGRTGPMSDWLQTHARMHTPFYSIEQVDATDSHVIWEIKPTGNDRLTPGK